MNTDFDSWWTNIGSGLAPRVSEDAEMHAQRVAAAAWTAAQHGMTSDNSREHAIRALLEEATRWHQDPHSPDYNECDKDPCHWCQLARGFLDGTVESAEILCALHGHGHDDDKGKGQCARQTFVLEMRKREENSTDNTDENEIRFLWREYVGCPISSLTPGAMRLRERLLWHANQAVQEHRQTQEQGGKR